MGDKHINACGERLCTVFSEQVSCYEALLHITKKLSGSIAVSKGDLTSLMSVMEEKQQLMQHLDTLTSENQTEMTLWQAEREHASESVREQVNSSLDRVTQAIERFLQAEKQLQKQLEFYGTAGKTE
ncbi:flagellar export chaperone FlgN [Chitinivibrio alkaliphilus]|uniref:Uncharacterized protein n=1 Tax=Chitinivibrio alkaliphilus ACht1 TaxID=1313304 RepID=U7DBA9_9BACT|nr:flagellar export chaperone FlgN [Chitinivibrio alkaliphilus]ERP38843.1 hypothetical protein CALK_0616 [Chitinivibrio alkaliphilus ACht1]